MGSSIVSHLRELDFMVIKIMICKAYPCILGLYLSWKVVDMSWRSGECQLIASIKEGDLGAFWLFCITGLCHSKQCQEQIQAPPGCQLPLALSLAFMLHGTPALCIPLGLAPAHHSPSPDNYLNCFLLPPSVPGMHLRKDALIQCESIATDIYRHLMSTLKSF